MATEEEWHEATKRWAYRLWLGHWDLKSVWSEDGAPGRSDRFHVAAGATTSPAYEMATLTGHAPAMKNMDAKELNKIACHESVHIVLTDWSIFVDELVKLLPKKARKLAEARADELWENVVTRMTKILTSAIVEWRDGDPRHGGDPIREATDA